MQTTYMYLLNKKNYKYKYLPSSPLNELCVTVSCIFLFEGKTDV